MIKIATVRTMSPPMAISQGLPVAIPTRITIPPIRTMAAMIANAIRMIRKMASKNFCTGLLAIGSASHRTSKATPAACCRFARTSARSSRASTCRANRSRLSDDSRARSCRATRCRDSDSDSDDAPAKRKERKARKGSGPESRTFGGLSGVLEDINIAALPAQLWAAAPFMAALLVLVMQNVMLRYAEAQA